jgi:transcriptional regulator with XRE-family HTH domain
MLNPKQAECLKLMMKNPRISGKELADTLNVSEKTISQWKNKNTDFQDEYNALVRSKIQYAATQALGKQIELLQSRNDMVAHLAAKDIMDRAGFAAVEKVEQQIDMDLNVVVDYGDND